MIPYQRYRLSLPITVTTLVVLTSVFNWPVAHPILLFTYLGLFAAYYYVRYKQDGATKQLQFIEKWERMRDMRTSFLVFNEGLRFIFGFVLIYGAANTVIYGWATYEQTVQVAVLTYPVRSSVFFLFYGIVAGIVSVRTKEKHYQQLLNDERGIEGIALDPEQQEEPNKDRIGGADDA